MTIEPHTVFIVDDDRSLLSSLHILLGLSGMNVRVFSSARQFLAASKPDTPACLVLDVRMAEISGVELQQRLIKDAWDLPIIFMTGHGDIAMSVKAMKAGAFEFLTKPFTEATLLEAITLALKKDRADRQSRHELATLREKRSRLTPREKQVMESVVSGLMNKQIAAKLGAAEKTIKSHRAQAMRKMEATSLADMVRMVEKLRVDG